MARRTVQLEVQEAELLCITVDQAGLWSQSKLIPVKHSNAIRCSKELPQSLCGQVPFRHSMRVDPSHAELWLCSKFMNWTCVTDQVQHFTQYSNNTAHVNKSVLLLNYYMGDWFLSVIDRIKFLCQLSTVLMGCKETRKFGLKHFS